MEESSDSFSYSNYYSYSSFQELTKTEKIIWTFPAVIIISVATIGNLMIIWIVMSNKRTRTVTNFFLMNLAISDVLRSTLDMPVLSGYLMKQVWTYGLVPCKIAMFVGNLTAFASIFSLVAVTIDRYRAIVFPFLPRFRKKMVYHGIALIWFLAAVWSSPHAIFTTVYNETDQCIMLWPGHTEYYGLADFCYNVATFFVVYMFPLVTMAICYYVIATRLWINNSPGEEVPNRSRQTKAKRKVVKMLILVISIFAVSWLPLHIYGMLSYLKPEVYKQDWSLHVYLVIWWLAMGSCITNPFIYYWLNDRFRYGFHRIFRCIFPCLRWRQSSFSEIQRDVLPVPLGKRFHNCSNNTLSSRSNFLLPLASGTSDSASGEDPLEGGLPNASMRYAKDKKGAGFRGVPSKLWDKNGNRNGSRITHVL